ncbi:hypothetical protein RRF57_002466 [Xylaria bambusicola]|uniref:Uncharacterized protein n=1 Tax=Xylaria bambusicola TaxID=326684 RepID=A0AAN7Z2I5_9PEZI
MLTVSSEILSEYRAPINGIPIKLPIVDVVEVAAKSRPDKDLSTLDARKARRLTVAPDPNVIIQKPTTRVERFDETAIEIAPAQRSSVLEDEIIKSRVNNLYFSPLEMNELAIGRSTKKRSEDMMALREKMSPA